MSRATVAIGILLLVWSVGCNKSSSRSNCGAGDAYTQNGHAYCVYRQEIIEEGFSCPLFVPKRFDWGAYVVCGTDDALPPDFRYEPDLVTPADTSGPLDTTTADVVSGVDTGGSDDAPTSDADSPPSHTFEVTIENKRSDTIFLDALFLPFGLKKDGVGLGLSAICPCTRCGTGDTCAYGEPFPMAVALPPGASITVTFTGKWYTTKNVTEQTCPETASWSRYCDEAHAFEPGTYEVSLGFDTQSAVEQQGLSATSQTRWGQTLWTQSPANIGTVTLSQKASSTFTLGSSPSKVTVTIPAQ